MSKIAFVAKNIPNPSNPENNDIIFKLAKRLSENFDLDFYFPLERIPFWLKFLPKHKIKSQIRSWNYDDFVIQIIHYFMLPNSQYAISHIGLKQEIRNSNLKESSLVHAHYLFPDGLVAYYNNHVHGTPYIISLRAHDINLIKKNHWNPFFLKLSKAILASSSKNLVFNHTTKLKIQEYLQVDTQIMPHGIDDDLILSDINNHEAKDFVDILVVSSFIKRKRIDWVIKAVKKYSGSKKINLNLIGDGPLWEKLKVHEDSNIKFRGKMTFEKVVEYMTRSEIFCLPSYGEII